MQKHYSWVTKIALLGCLIVFSLAVACVAGPQGPVGPAGLPGPAGEKGPAGSPAPSPGANLIVVPSEITVKAKSIEVVGSGFKPKEQVNIGMVASWEEGNYWMDTFQVNESGAFAKTVSLEYPLRAIKPGLYTVIAEGESGSQATAPLKIVEE